MNSRVFSGVFVLAILCHAQSLVQDAPAKFAERSNPLEHSATAAAAGAKLFDRHCAACHGKSGEGTPGAPSIKRADLSHVSAGALFWVLKNGSLNHGMPSFAHLPAAQRWQIVTFIQRLNAQ